MNKYRVYLDTHDRDYHDFIAVPNQIRNLTGARQQTRHSL